MKSVNTGHVPTANTPSTTPARGASPGASTAGETSATAARLLDQLRLSQGQSTIARVVQVLEQSGARPAQTLLALRGQTLPVNSDTSLQPGQWVRVARAGNELRLTEQLAPTQTREARIARQLAQHLPWQHRLDTGMSALRQALQTTAQPATMPQGLSDGARQSIEQLFQQLPRSTQLDSNQRSTTDAIDRVRSWIRDSGLFTESHLARGAKDPAGAPDLKLALSRVITSLLQSRGEPTQAFNRYTPLTSPDLMKAPLQFPPPLTTGTDTNTAQPGRDNASTAQMLRMLSGMLNRINVNQLHSQTLGAAPAAADAPGTPGTPTLLMELPWVDASEQTRFAQMRLEKHGKEDEGASDGEHRQVAQWRLTLSVDLAEAGTVTFELALQQQQLSGRIWADRTKTLHDARETLPDLTRRLADLGLEVTELECRRGQPAGVRTQLEQRLVDTRA
ncbi:flagellar hook-length control protein FliK [Tamilnaduibacter salinus]|uniref:Flagellar hook-length control protein FliK n=1 Tax=Tamilnaduibacter salinus TaxID=1484056 RepID=A0A2U1D1M8_9GAMM|nr:flagellar hook-length control protein FliK [Tamilnaduibacter salinus]PVY79282.1 flagellar hook-length control protein FliK [Tamilnaduibacter salinus]